MEPLSISEEKNSDESLSNNKATQLTNQIIDGYIHQVQSSFSTDNAYYNIPNEIAHLISLFIDNYFSTNAKHTWEITDPALITKILTAAVGDKFTSAPFTMLNCKWQFEIHPNGNKPELQGFFVIHVRLLSLPSDDIECITIWRMLRVLENSACSGWMETVGIDQSVWWTRKCPLKELIDLNTNTISIQVEVFIQKLKMKKALSESQRFINKEFPYPKTGSIEWTLTGRRTRPKHSRNQLIINHC